MARVARHKQVLCVTHLPQIAAMADAHLLRGEGGGGGAHLHRGGAALPAAAQGGAGRLTSGEQITPTSLKAAEELLDGAERFKDGALRD